MRNFIIFCTLFLLFSCGDAVKQKEYVSPEKLFPEIFLEAQKSGFNMAEFLDATALYKPEEINKNFEKQRSEKGFSFNEFFKLNFRKNTEDNIYTQKVNSREDLISYVEKTLGSLKRFPKDDSSSLIPTRKEYYSGGPSYEEFNYFNSFILMKGFLENNKIEEAENLLLNAAQFVQDYGFVPQGNRSYLLDRSNPPVFALLVAEMAKHKPDVLPQYASLLTKEYQFWMAAQSKEESQIFSNLKNNKTYAYKKAVLMPDKNLLNRFFVSSKGVSKSSGYESGFGSQSLLTAEESNDLEGPRWKINGDNISPEHFLAVDLNAFLYFMEKTLSEAYREKGNPEYANSFKFLAEKRRNAFNKYFWNEKLGYYRDFNFKTLSQSEVSSSAGLWPVYLGLADKNQTSKALFFLEKHLLKQEGVADYYSINASENIFSFKSQFIGFLVAKEAKNEVLAETIRDRWLETNLNFAKNNGKIEATYFSKAKPHQPNRIDGALGVLSFFLKQ